MDLTVWWGGWTVALILNIVNAFGLCALICNNNIGGRQLQNWFQCLFHWELFFFKPVIFWLFCLNSSFFNHCVHRSICELKYVPLGQKESDFSTLSSGQAVRGLCCHEPCKCAYQEQHDKDCSFLWGWAHLLFCCCQEGELGFSLLCPVCQPCSYSPSACIPAQV